MITTNKRAKKGTDIKGIEYTGQSSTTLSKNQLCYVQGTVPATYSTQDILNVEYYFPSWVQLDNDRVLMLWVTQSPLNLMGIVATFNDGDDKLTKPLLYEDSDIMTIVESFPFSSTSKYNLVKLNYTDREICLFQYGLNIYLIEIKNGKTIELITKGELSNSGYSDSSYIEIYGIPAEKMIPTTYGYLTFGINNPNRLIVRFYETIDSGKTMSDVSAQLIVPTSATCQILKAFPINNEDYIVVINATDSTKTTLMFYNITVSDGLYPSVIKLQSTVTLQKIYTNLFCNFKDGLICVSGNETNTQITTLFMFQIKNNNIISYKEVTQKISASGSGWNSNTVSLQNTILSNNTICSFDVNSGENDYFLYSISANEVLEIKSFGGNNTISITQNNLPIVRNNTIYNLYTTLLLKRSWINVSVINIENSVYPLLSLDSVMVNSTGIAKDNYAEGETATIVHPTNQ